MKTREVVNEIDDHEIEGRDEAAEQQHRDDHDHRGISQLLEPPNAFVLRFPRPRRFSQLGAVFAEKVFRFCDHENVSKNQVRRDSNPQPTVLETATLPIELLTYRNSDLRFQIYDLIQPTRRRSVRNILQSSI